MPAFVPELFFLAVAPGGVTIDIGANGVKSQVALINEGDPIWVNFTNAPPPAANGNGQFRMVNGASLNLSGVNVRFVSANCAPATAGQLQIAAVQNAAGGGVL